MPTIHSCEIGKSLYLDFEVEGGEGGDRGEAEAVGFAALHFPDVRSAAGVGVIAFEGDGCVFGDTGVGHSVGGVAVVSAATFDEHGLRIPDEDEGDGLQAFFLVHDGLVPPVVHDDHVLRACVVVVGFDPSVLQVHYEPAVESRRALRPEVAMVEVRPRLRISQPTVNHLLYRESIVRWY